MEVLRPQGFAFETYYRSGHSQAIRSVHEEYEKLEGLTKDVVTLHIVPSTAEPFTALFNRSDMRLVVWPGFTRGVEYYPTRVMRQFGFCQDTFEESLMPKFFRLYPLSSTVMTTELSRLLRCGVQSTDIAVVKGSSYTPEYLALV